MVVMVVVLCSCLGRVDFVSGSIIIQSVPLSDTAAAAAAAAVIILRVITYPSLLWTDVHILRQITKQLIPFRWIIMIS